MKTDEAKELWLQSFLLLRAWAQHSEHPQCPIYRAALAKQMDKLRAAVTRAEAIMESTDASPEH